MHIQTLFVTSLLFLGVRCIAFPEPAVHKSCTTTVKKPSCTRTFVYVHTVTKKTTPITTSTVYSTTTFTASTSTSIATDTETDTAIDIVTSTETDLATTTTTSTSTVTTYLYPTGAAAAKKRQMVEEVPAKRALPNPAANTKPRPTGCKIEHCSTTVKRITASTTITSTLRPVTTTHSATVSTTVTPNASSTTTVTTTFTSTSTDTAVVTDTATSTATSTSTYIAKPTFYVESSGDLSIADGTLLQAIYPGSSETTLSFTGTSTLFALDPSTGEVSKTSDGSVLNVNPSFLSPLYFDPLDTIIGSGYPICSCSIDPSTYDFLCNCYGDTVFQTSGQALLIATSLQSGLFSETPVAVIVDQN